MLSCPRDKMHINEDFVSLNILIVNTNSLTDYFGLCCWNAVELLSLAFWNMKAKYNSITVYEKRRKISSLQQQLLYNINFYYLLHWVFQLQGGDGAWHSLDYYQTAVISCSARQHNNSNNSFSEYNKL